MSERPPIHIGILLFPDVTQLDAMGPAQVLCMVAGAKLHLVWKDTRPVMTEGGFAIVPTVSFADCPPLDVICVPGGVGQVWLLRDRVVIDFLRAQAVQARYVTSVCTGSLLLGAASLLKGYKAGCHWMWRDMLAAFGAEPVAARVVRDRNRITGGGVTAGIDFGLTLAAELAGETTARRIQLIVEYDPAPPFASGSPTQARPGDVERTLAVMRRPLEEWRATVALAAREV
jgi:cyclohexyl-isocyanide hydratase